MGKDEDRNRVAPRGRESLNNKMAPVLLGVRLSALGGVGPLTYHGSQVAPCLYLAKGLALNLEIKQPAVPVCTGISDTVRNLICVTAETQLEANQTEADSPSEGRRGLRAHEGTH